MKKYSAFSLIEIGIVLFIITAVFFIIVPLSVSNVKQAKFIAAWKDYNSQAAYSFETLTEYKKYHNINDKDSVKRLIEYLDGREIPKDSKEIKHYRYKMMNGKFYEKLNVKNFDEIYQDNRNRLLGVKYNNSNSPNDALKATVWIDLNGRKKPNIVGKDILILEIYSDGVEPYGKGVKVSVMKKDCSCMGTGMLCSKYYLMGGDLD